MFGNQQPLYGNPYPARYPQYQTPVQPFYSPMAPIPQQPSGLIQVTGMEGAKAYPMTPNSVVPLFDADRDVMYIKRADAGGYPTIQTYRFSLIQETEKDASSEYVTRTEFEKLKEMIVNGVQPVPRAADAEPVT